jgi:2-amino-4-hydroxy-6-hydroxymethyldihydropteridine diphosphokinase / dihydropteroate synthase
MVILGLGSNIGDRLAFLRQAKFELKKNPAISIEQVSPVYVSDALLPDGSPHTWDTPYLNLALRCNTRLSPLELLHYCKDIELNIGRTDSHHWGPRPIDIDILAWDDLVIYDEKLHIPHEGLHERPFALWPLVDVAPRWIYPLAGPNQGKSAADIASKWGSRFTGDAPLHTRQILQRIDTSQLIGIINVSPDSFSDGGKYSDAISAIQHAHTLIECGAEILDLGAEATGPDATPLDPDTEWQRLEPVLTGVLAQSKNLLIIPKISVDTRHVITARKALELGVDWINDVSGLTDPAMSELIAASSCDVVVMHQLGIPASNKHVLPSTEDPVELVYAWLENQLNILEKKGIKRERIIADIGIGFGKTAYQSLELLQQINHFKTLDVRLLVGHSRKSFLKIFTNKSASERDVETQAISLFLSQQNIDYLRVHNVEMTARGIKIAKSLA